MPTPSQSPETPSIRQMLSRAHEGHIRELAALERGESWAARANRTRTAGSLRGLREVREAIERLEPQLERREPHV